MVGAQERLPALRAACLQRGLHGAPQALLDLAPMTAAHWWLSRMFNLTAVPARQAAAAGGGAAAAPRGAREACPQCGERFGTLQELLFHAEAFHPAGAATGGGGGGGGGLERCPHCARQFRDAVAVEHVERVEREHRRGKACAMC
jgi:hypothetical protein